MRIHLFLALVCVASFQHALAALARWDALPALEVTHLQGAYAGTRVCPMCRHGYDAGLLVLIPASSEPAAARDVAQRMHDAAAAVDDPRFRQFLVLVGDAPSQALLAALRDDSERWYVAQLSSEAAEGAAEDLGAALTEESRGYVFAQRRLLWTFDPFADGTPNTTLLHRHVRYAMSVLQIAYPHVAADEADPDTPKGRLWLAPSKLATEVLMSDPASAASNDRIRLCLGPEDESGVTSGPAHRESQLIGFSLHGSPQPARIWWARSDDAGCVHVAGAPEARDLQLEVFTPLRSMRMLRADTAAWSDGMRIELDPDETSASTIDRVDVVTGRETIVGLPCEGCEAVFDRIPAALLAAASSPTDAISVAARIAPLHEPGARLRLTGVVRDASGAVRSGIVVYAYQTDARGIYPRPTDGGGAGARHGRLRGWTRTDSNGRYAFDTIRPGAYADSDEPQHIHLHVIEPGRCTYYIGDVLFDDDPRLDAKARAAAADARGGSGIASPVADSQLGWQATRNITLGRNVPGHHACSTSGVAQP